MGYFEEKSKLLIEIKLVCKLEKLYESELQPYLENDDLDNLPESKQKCLEMWRKARLRNFELYEKLQSLGVNDEDIYKYP